MKVISSSELREKYQQFFEEKGHVRITGAPLVPEHDSSVLFTTAGMHPLVPYLKGQPHPQGKKLTNVQKCLRTTDIDEVGDATHATVFEMLGNWSLGDYFKREAIEWSWEFLTDKKWLGISPAYLAVSIFRGILPKIKTAEDSAVFTDMESAKQWRKAGLPKDRVAYLGTEENWWPAYAAKVPTGPQGPDTEMFYWTGEDRPPKTFNPADKNWVEIWNDVFMEYDGQKNGGLKRLAQKNVDTGMGLERTVMALNGLKSIYEIDTYIGLMSLIEQHTQKNDERQKRILADHIKAATFVMTDKNPVKAGNTEQGYVLRRLIRRAVMKAKALGVQNYEDFMTAGMNLIVKQYGQDYPAMKNNISLAKEWMSEEVRRFEQVLADGLGRLSVLVKQKQRGEIIAGSDAFNFYETYGFPVELTQEVAREHGLTVDRKGFEEALRKHQEESRSAAAGKFAGGLADQSAQVIRYHTATHLLHQALREVLGSHVLQRGSNITAKRMRFDFLHPEKMTLAELRQVEKIVNEKIAQDLLVTREEMTVHEAKDKGAWGLFESKYGDRVSVYTIGDYSMEICGGPHAKRTGVLGTFKIKKEESSSAGVRRIKAELI